MATACLEYGGPEGESTWLIVNHAAFFDCNYQADVFLYSVYSFMCYAWGKNHTNLHIRKVNQLFKMYTQFSPCFKYTLFCERL